MPQAVTGSTVPRRQLGRYLRDLRNQAGLTVRRAANLLERAEATLWRIETGQTSLRGVDVETMCRIYGASAEMTAVLVGLAKETKAKGWWHSYGDVIPEYFDLYIGLEESAGHFQWYESELVPGLLQTEEYARILITKGTPERADGEIERRIHVRTARQSILSRATEPPELKIVLNESVLRRPIGGTVVMRRQIERLIAANELAPIDLRIVPFSVGFHAGVAWGPFVVLRFPAYGEGRLSEPPTVYREGLTGALYLDQPHEVELHEHVFSQIWDVALNPSESTKLMVQISKELEK
jgi:transcriptional regulator with XRE-family HTH domain